MKKISKIEPTIPDLPKRKHVAAYARVSRDTERLMNSVSAQISYYRNLIQNHPEWDYAGVYADCGISGTSTANRNEFIRMLADCEAGKIDLILCKSISRFARNTVDLLETIRHLKELGIEVWFEKEQIHSLSEDGELMLSLLASFAQEESWSISENSKWGIRKRFQSGEIGVANKRLLGYEYQEEQKKYKIIPQEAKAVRWMFQMYIDGVSLRDIAKNMNQSGIRTVLGNEFQEASVRQMIFNEVYAGDIRRQKCYVADPITKEKVKNNGELPQYYMPDCHEAIIDRETYAKVQAEMKRRASMKNPKYLFTGKIKCGICGRHYTRRHVTVKGKKYVSWFCRTKKEKGVTCNSVNYSELEIREIFCNIMGQRAFDEHFFTKTVEHMVIQKTGSIDFFLKDGTVKTYETLKMQTKAGETSGGKMCNYNTSHKEQIYG